MLKLERKNNMNEIKFNCKRLESLTVQKVIVIKLLRGEGTKEDMCRIVTQFWDIEGNYLFEIDPCKKEKE